MRTQIAQEATGENNLFCFVRLHPGQEASVQSLRATQREGARACPKYYRDDYRGICTRRLAISGGHTRNPAAKTITAGPITSSSTPYIRAYNIVTGAGVL